MAFPLVPTRNKLYFSSTEPAAGRIGVRAPDGASRKDVFRAFVIRSRRRVYVYTIILRTVYTRYSISHTHTHTHACVRKRARAKRDA